MMKGWTVVPVGLLALAASTANASEDDGAAPELLTPALQAAPVAEDQPGFPADEDVAAACPAGFPIDCNNGWCCDTAHPTCCPGGTCSSTGSCGGGGGNCPAGQMQCGTTNFCIPVGAQCCDLNGSYCPAGTACDGQGHCFSTAPPPPTYDEGCNAAGSSSIAVMASVVALFGVRRRRKPLTRTGTS